VYIYLGAERTDRPIEEIKPVTQQQPTPTDELITAYKQQAKVAVAPVVVVPATQATTPPVDPNYQPSAPATQQPAAIEPDPGYVQQAATTAGGPSIMVVGLVVAGAFLLYDLLTGGKKWQPPNRK